jgi:membrane associated rhomboid family serine protease
MALVKGLMGVNVAVFGYGLYAREQHKQGYSSNLAKFMTNMTMSVNGFKRGYYWQAITSVFTHIDPIHLLFNMATFWFMGKFLAASSCITPGRYMAIVLGSGVAGSLGYLKSQEYKSQTDRFAEHQRGLGFSGALMGVTTVAACLSPRTKVAIWGVLPVPLGVLTLCYALYDGYYLNSKNSRTAHSGHLGGTAFGLLYYFLKLRGLKIPGSL